MKSIIRKFKKRKYYRALNTTVYLLMRIEDLMKGQKWAAYRRKQFWRDFIKSPASREMVFREMFDNINRTDEGGKK